MTSWADIVRRVADGMPVNAAADGAPISDLEQRTTYLREAFDAASAGRALIDFDVPLDAATVVCTPVYIDTDGVWKPALAEINTTGPLTGKLTKRAYVAGVVLAKATATSGDVLLGGIFDGLPLVNVLGGAAAVPGNYFLSPVNAGQLIIEGQGSASVAVGQLLADGSFLFSHWPKNGAEDHLHFKFALNAAPAVTAVVPPVVGQPHVLNNTLINTGVTGWLPIGCAGTPPYPVGAKFWYNIAADPVLAQAFPPIPVLAYCATQGRGIVLDSDLVVTSHGIFWMQNNYGEVPWPVTYTGTAPNNTTDAIALFFAKMNIDTFSRVVRSLTPSPSSVLPIRITSSDGQDGITGDVFISVDSLLPVVATADMAPTALKTINGNALTSGPVVTGIVAASAGVVITAEAATNGFGYGKIAIAIDAGLINNFLLPDEIRHVGTREDQLQDFSYVALPNGRATSCVASFEVPTIGTPGMSQFELHLTWIGVAASATFSLTVQAKKVSLGAAVPTVWTPLGTVNATIANGQVQDVAAVTKIPSVLPGDTILIQISRPVDAVTAVAGLLRIHGVLIS